jgi:hypothetical protein
MPTFMSEDTFNHLSAAWQRLESEHVGVSNVFVPWAGEDLKAAGQGLYYIGIAVDKAAKTGDQHFDNALRSTEAFCLRPARGHAPFWRFLDQLTRELLGGPYDQTQRRWGWSNLLKIAADSGEPSSWPERLRAEQLSACKLALQEELSNLKKSIIVVVSNKEHGILDAVLGDTVQWQPHGSQISWCRDQHSNLYVHCNHPNYMNYQKDLFQRDSKRHRRIGTRGLCRKVATIGLAAAENAGAIIPH